MFGKKAQPALDPVAVAQAQRAQEEQEVQAAFQRGITALRDFISPSSIELFNTHFQIGTRYARTFYVYGYPRQVYTGWLSGRSGHMIDVAVPLTILVPKSGNARLS